MSVLEPGPGQGEKGCPESCSSLLQWHALEMWGPYRKLEVLLAQQGKVDTRKQNRSSICQGPRLMCRVLITWPLSSEPHMKLLILV